MTGCNYDLIHHYGNGTLGDVDRVLKFYASYKNHEVNYAGLRCGSSLFLPFIKEIGFAERYCSHVRAVTIMSWPPILDQNFNPADLIPKCILDNDEKSVKSDVLGSSHAWRLRFLDRVNQHRSTESMSNVLLNIELCKSVQWTLLQLKNKPDLNVKTTQEVIDATGKKNWTVQCADTQLGLSAKSDSNSELNAVHLVDNIKVNRTDKAYRNLFSESAMEICATYEVIDKPKDPHGEGLWMIGIQVSFITEADSKGTKFDSKGTKIDSKGTKVDPKGTKNGKKRTKGSLGGGTTPIPDYNVEDSARSGVGSDIHKLWMISSFGVITLQFFFIFF